MSDLLATYPAGQTDPDNFREDGPEGAEPDTSVDRVKVLNAVDWNTILADLRAVEADLLASFQGETTLSLRIADVLARLVSLEGAPPAGDLFSTNNLSDLADILTARGNLGNVQTLSEVNALIAAVGHLLAANNLSDLVNATTARGNLGSVQTLTEINALIAAAGHLIAASNLSDLANAATARSNLGSVQTLTEINALVAAAGHLLLTGGTMTGALTLFGAPTVDLHAATKKYVDDNVGGGGISAKHAIGRLHGNGSISASLTATLTPNSVIAYPWKLDTSRTYDALFARIHASGSGELRVGVWADLNGDPGALLADSGDLGNTVGMQSGILSSFSPSSPDVWLGMRATTALVVRRGAAILRELLNPGTDDTTDGLIRVAVRRTVAGGGALPDPFGAVGSLESSLIFIPAIWARPGS